MVNYQLGKIYKIVGNGKIYIGSTCERLLCQRLAGHKRNYNQHQSGTYGYMTSFQCITDPNHYIELLELCPCCSKDELHTIERTWIDKLECVNKVKPMRTENECKDYYENYKNANKEKSNERMKKYYKDNKQTINENKRIKYTCNCGAIINICEKARHERSVKHQNN